MKRLRPARRLFGRAGVAVFELFASETLWTILWILISFGGVVPILYKYVWKPKLLARQLEQNGVEAKATIRSVSETGTLINHQPELNIALQVHPAGEESFYASAQQPVSVTQLADYRAGAEVWVRYDPQDHRRLRIERVDRNAPLSPVS